MLATPIWFPFKKCITMGVKNVKPSDQTKKDTDTNTDTPAASAPMRDFSAPPPPMLRDSSKFQTIVSAGTNPLDRIYKGSKQKELEEKQNHSLEDIDLREKLNHSKKHGYHPIQGNLLEGIDNWSGADCKNQNSLTTVLASIFLYFN